MDISMKFFIIKIYLIPIQLMPSTFPRYYLEAPPVPIKISRNIKPPKNCNYYYIIYSTKFL